MTHDVETRLLEKLEELRVRAEELDAALADPEVSVDHRRVREIATARAALRPIVEVHAKWRRCTEEIAGHEALLAEEPEGELAALARGELPALRDRAAALLEEAKERLVVADDRAVGSVILEVRAGVGGDEAALWAGDLLEMYRRFAARRGLAVEELDFAPADRGGVRHGILALRGDGAWQLLGYEGGTHQVKRVPATEAQGRVHTSTATVAVLPEPEEIAVELDPGDVREIMTTSQGPGGQNVNKVATCVHLIHEPTGISVKMQETKSQVQNRERAWKLLRARLYERQRAEHEADRAEQRHAMIGSGDRAEKVRTYRWKENLVVDHRVRASANLSEVMAGDLDAIVDALIREDVARRLAAL